MMAKLTTRQRRLRKLYTSKAFTRVKLTIGSQAFTVADLNHVEPKYRRDDACKCRDMLAIALDKLLTNELPPRG
jgi:hypothetical protein